MRALRFTPWSPRAAYAAVAGGRRPLAWAAGPRSPLRLAEVAAPVLPGDQWVRIAVDLAGICGSDLKLLRVTGMSPTVSAFVDWRQPMILGHEIVGHVVEAGAASGLREGERVVAEPTLSCADRGFPPCPACVAGQDHRCAFAAQAAALPAGHGFGFNERYGGGWAEQVVAPGWRCVRVSEALADEAAVLAEPMAIAVHAVERALHLGGRALVIGPGTLGLCTLIALRAEHPDVEVSVAGLGSFADELCTRYGAGGLLHGTGRQLLQAAAEDTGGTLRRPVVGLPVLDGGYDTVFDCVGSAQTIRDGLRLLRPGGQLVLIGTAGRLTADWSLVWLRELQITGAVYYADRADGRRTFDRSVEILADAQPADLVTHRFALEDATEALLTAAAGPSAGAVKVTFLP